MKTKTIVWQTLDSRCPTFTGCGCLPKQSVTICSSTNFARKLQDGPVDFAARRLVLGHSDKRRVVTDIGVYPVSLWTVINSLSFSCYQSSSDACHYWRNWSGEIPHRRPSCMLQCICIEKTLLPGQVLFLSLWLAAGVSSERTDGEGITLV